MPDQQEALKLSLTKLQVWTGQRVRFTIGGHVMEGLVEHEPYDSVSGGKAISVVCREPIASELFIAKSVEYHFVLDLRELEVVE